MPPYYGVFLDIRDRSCAVFGGDAHEGQRKVKYLLECGAKVTLFAPEENTAPSLAQMAMKGTITWVKRGYLPNDLKDTWLVIVADTSDHNVNLAIHQEAEKRNVLLNIMDVTHLCNFIAPALVHRGPVTTAISTGGASPALAKRLRETMSGAQCVCHRWADVGDVLARARQHVRARGVFPCPGRWQAVMTEEWLEQAKSSTPDNALQMLCEELEKCHACNPPSDCRWPTL